MHDVAAVAVAVEPGIAQVEGQAVAAELRGELTRSRWSGCPARSRAGPASDLLSAGCRSGVITDIDRERLSELVVKRLAKGLGAA
jgi:inosine-uridine nucleoside N-ribohydrolase